MKNADLGLFKKGTYEPINNDFMTEGLDVLKQVQVVQEKYNKLDSDSFMNELRDQIVGYYLGYDLVNTDKHGFDCKVIKDDKSKFLEVKEASFSASNWTATFNDTTLEKAEAFKDEKLTLALAVWKGFSELMFICYGQNEKIGELLESRVKNFLYKKKGVRSTQTISIIQLIKDYNFKILAIKPKEEVVEILRIKNRSLRNLDENIVIELKDLYKEDEV